MTLATMTWQAKVTGLPAHADIVLEHATVTVELDEAHAPYLEATIRAALPSDVQLIDPRLDPRPRLTLTGTNDVLGGASTTVTADLVVHEAHVNAKRAELTLICRSDEALLVDLAHVDLEPLHHSGLAVVPLVQWALAQIGATLTTGDDRTEELTSEPAEPTLTNLVTNPSGETGIAGWTSGGLTLTSSTDWAAAGSRALKAVVSAPASAYLEATTPGATPGKRYTFAATVRLAAPLTGAEANDSARRIGIVDEVGAAQQFTYTDPFPNAAGTYPLFVTRTMRATATRLAPRLQIFHGGTIYLDKACLVEGNTAVQFDGDTPDTAVYDFAWMGTPHASTSTRTWKPNSLAARIEPGQYLWDWLAPILTATGLRLYCDAARQWHLVPATQTVPGVIQVSGASNAVDVDDAIRLAGDYCDSVVIRYRWRDETGQQHEAIDVAGTGGRTKVITYEAPYPGPGAAAGVLDRAQGRGHAQQLTALADLSARPGMTVISIIAGLVRQVGKIAAVRFTDDGLMHIRTRGLMDTPLTAWIFAEGQWVEQLETWATYTGPED